MLRLVMYLFLLLSVLSCERTERDGWHYSKDLLAEDKLYKQDDIFTYYFDPDVPIESRNRIIQKSKEYIIDNLRIINEINIEDSAQIIFVRDKNEMKKLIGRNIGGVVYPAGYVGDKNIVLCVYGSDITLKHELMHLVTMCKWGDGDIDLRWLDEGLSCYAEVEEEGGNYYTYEEKFTALLQHDKLTNIDTLVYNFVGSELTGDSIETLFRYIQSAYIVEYMLGNYELEKIKKFWGYNMKYFEEVFGLKLEDMVQNIKEIQMKKYPHPIEPDWEILRKKLIYDATHPSRRVSVDLPLQ